MGKLHNHILMHLFQLIQMVQKSVLQDEMPIFIHQNKIIRVLSLWPLTF